MFSLISPPSIEVVTHPKGGASRAFGLPRAAVERFLRVKAHTHFRRGQTAVGRNGNGKKIRRQMIHDNKKG